MKILASIAIIISMSTTSMMNEKIENEMLWQSLGGWRITHYCVGCSSTVNAMGKYPTSGTVAMNGVPLGSIIKIDGMEYVVEDRCGINGTVDIFQATDTCRCQHLDYKEVFIKNSVIQTQNIRH